MQGEAMRRLAQILILMLFIPLGAANAGEQSLLAKPGLEPYIPTRVEWLALAVNSQVRQDITQESLFTLSVVNSDHETLVIYVRYHSTVNRQIMNMAIDTARKVIAIRAKGYGWENWVHVREDIELGK